MKKYKTDQKVKRRQHKMKYYTAYFKLQKPLKQHGWYLCMKCIAV